MAKHVYYTKSGHKQIRNSIGYVLKTYYDIPTNIKFSHKAVNDDNQRLSGDWFLHTNLEFEDVDRVALGLKPMGISHTTNQNAILDKMTELHEKGLLVSCTNNPHVKGIYDITASVNRRLGAYFDLETLAKGYERNGLDGDIIREYSDTHFLDFHRGKYEKAPFPIIGLIFGYPVENTIALIRQNMVY